MVEGPNMTDKERQELFEALSGYYPYGVLTEHNGEVYPVYSVYNDGSFIVGNEHSRTSGEIDKMYLRSMSSMTDEEKEELRQEHIKDEKLFAECLTKEANGDSSMRGKVVPHFAADWCNKNHFDYRGLIPRGLAIESKEGMYKEK